MKTIYRSAYFFVLNLLVTFCVHAQQANHLQFVDPFIGTAKSSVLTKWGNEGGTYPGAVAPSGYIQLSPETRFAKGYNYGDSSIYYFSCFKHMSGYPEGSTGSFYVMPVSAGANLETGHYSRKFSHQNEAATPGYYKVIFNDDHTVTEVTTTIRTGIFRFTFAAGCVPQVFIGDAGQISVVSKKTIRASKGNAVINFTEAYTFKKQVPNGWLFTFASAKATKKIIELRLSASQVGFASAQINIDKETGGLSFEQIRKQTSSEWLKKLAVVDITDSSRQNKTVYYTALYHSLLVPWVISDANGQYKGADGQVHQKTGAEQYGAFSPWDTFRSLHPLLTLLYPDKQKDIILSMLDIYKQTGHLPTESMTGNHAIPIIVDSYLKGITGFDKQLAYTAMKKSVIDPPFVQPDMEVFNELGYIPYTRSESVTRTVEYAYDDWALSQFAKNVIGNNNDYQLLVNRGNNYRNLLNKDELLLLPKNNDEFKLQPGMSGYKEGDKWVYSYFVPHNTKNLINYTGGNQAFVNRLDSLLTNHVILFDNETVFHLPYVFNQAGHPALTQKWVRQIMLNRFAATPGGLPGNDDLGATSSWYVFSAMGIYPVCPGRPDYAIGAPLFNKVLMHLPNGKTFIISNANTSAANNYIQALTVNGNSCQQLIIPHSVLAAGGAMSFTMGTTKSSWPDDKDPVALSETKENSDFKVLNFSVSHHIVVPNQPITVHFSIANKGAAGIKIVTVFINGKPYGFKNCMVPSNGIINDSLLCRLYPVGKTELKLEGQTPVIIDVKMPEKAVARPYSITAFTARSMIRVGEQQQLSYKIQNIGGLKQTFNIPVKNNDALIFTDTVVLEPGETQLIKHLFTATSAGMQQLSAGDEKVVFKVYKDNVESILLDLSPLNISADNLVKDNSGFNNNGHINTTEKRDEGRLISFDEKTFVEVPNAADLDNMDETITMMGWIYPTGNEHGLVDIITKGDSHVLQVTDHKTLTFFAGGWGRGDCTVSLPAGWNNNWHHIAGVCTGKTLYLYIDGALAGTTITGATANLSVNNKWTLGRNEEFPSERIYHGFIDKVKVFKAPLSLKDIDAIMEKEKLQMKRP